MHPHPTPPPQDHSPTLLAFANCFNTSQFYEAHDVLEEIWLPLRRTDTGELYKGLIQLAAAFVHVQKSRRGPALALLQTAQQRIQNSTITPPALQLPQAIQITQTWLQLLHDHPHTPLPTLLQNHHPHLSP